LLPAGQPLCDAYSAPLRQAVRIWCRHALAGSTLEGVEFLEEAVAAGPTAVVCNHQSYIDTILCAHADDELANRFVSAAGPKVYEGLLLRLVSTSLNTIPMKGRPSTPTQVT